MTQADRMTRLEEMLTHQAATIDDLSEIVRTQAERIEHLERRVNQLRERAAQAESDGGILFSNQKPPHY